MTVQRGVRLAALLLIIGLAVWNLYLLRAGVAYIEVNQVLPGQPLPPAWTLYHPNQSAGLSLLALLPIAIGLLRCKWLPLAWLGLLLHLTVGGLLNWGAGATYIGVTVAIAVPASILDWQVTRQKKWPLAAGAGVAIVLYFGHLFVGNEYGVAFLVVAAMLAVMLVGSWRFQRA